MQRRWKIILSLTPLLIVAVGIAGFYWNSSRSAQQSPQQETSLTVPDREEVIALLGATMEDFAQAVSKKNFADFYGKSSLLWQKQTTPEKITAAFEGFFPFAKEVRAAVDDGPTLNAPPLINETNVLVVQGFYPIEATKMLFRLQYVREDSSWKLLGMNLEVK